MQKIESKKQIRKLQISGGSTYVISLPKDWVEELKLGSGDPMIVVKNHNNSITLYGNEPEAEQKNKTTLNLSLQDSPESIRRKIIATYLAGYNFINIKSKGLRLNPTHSKAIRNLVRTSMIGTEILESSSEGITIQILTRFPELSFETALKRIFIMASNMHKESIEALSNSDMEHAEEIVRMDEEVDRFSLYMRRNLTLAVENEGVLRELGLQKASDCLGHRAVISRIERIADHAVLIAKRVKFVHGTIEPAIIKKIQKISDEALDAFEESIKALTTKNFDLAEKTAVKVSEVKESEKKLMSSLPESENITVLRFVLEDIKRTAEYSGDIIEVVIDENISNILSEK